MSKENVGTVRALIAAWNAGDRDVTRLSKYLDPAIELESPFSAVAGEPYRGYAGIEQWMRDLDEQFDEWAIAVAETREVGDQVVATATVRARGRSSGATLAFDAATACDLTTDHRVTRIHIFLGAEEALKAVGLED
jgi:ketosteroid isomerase-like protein